MQKLSWQIGRTLLTVKHSPELYLLKDPFNTQSGQISNEQPHCSDYKSSLPRHSAAELDLPDREQKENLSPECNRIPATHSAVM